MGGTDFRVFDSGSRDKMLLRLNLEKDKEYTIREHSVKTIARGIVMGDDPAAEEKAERDLGKNGVVQDVSMAFVFWVEAFLHGGGDSSLTPPRETSKKKSGQPGEWEGVKLQFNCTEFEIRSKEGEKWSVPPVWKTMAKAVLNKPFSAVVAANGTMISMDATKVHEAVVEEMHQAGALPVEMTTALQITKPAMIKGKPALIVSIWSSPKGVGVGSAVGPCMPCDRRHS